MFVDPDWAIDRLLAFFDWNKSEDEAVALWRAYASHARVNPELWSSLEDNFFSSFTPDRLRRIGSGAEALAGILMVVGVEFPQSDTPPDRCQNAVRAMTPQAREAAVFWLYSYLEGPRIENANRQDIKDRADSTDHLWRVRVAPWLRRIWPRDLNLIEPGTSELFDLLAIATNRAFDDAVTMLLPHIGPTDRWGPPVSALLKSNHPHCSPTSTLTLLGRLIAPRGPIHSGVLRPVLDRITAAKGELRQNIVFKKLDAALKAAGG